MSHLSSRLRTRLLPRSDGAGVASDTLASLAPGSRCRVVGLDEGAHPDTSRRLFDLGFAPGAEVVVVRRAPMADPVIFRIAGSEMALRRAQAECVLVRTTQ